MSENLGGLLRLETSPLILTKVGKYSEGSEGDDGLESR